VSHHRGVAIYMNKYLKEKEELWKLKYFTMQKKKKSKKKQTNRQQKPNLQKIL
jgi:hypothetical protein